MKEKSTLPPPSAGIFALTGDGTTGRGRQFPGVLFFQDMQEVGNHRIFEKITSQPPVPVKIDHPVPAQQRQVLRYVRLVYVQEGSKITHTLHAFRKFFKDMNPDGMGDHPQDLHALPERPHIPFPTGGHICKYCNNCIFALKKNQSRSMISMSFDLSFICSVRTSRINMHACITL